MKKSQLKETIKSEIVEILKEDKSFTSPGVGDRVTIPFDLTTDPINKQGETGEVKFIDENGTVYVLFDDGLVGGYQPDVFEEEISEASEEEIERQKELNKELEKTKELSSELSEDIDDDDEPKSSEIKDDSITKIAKKLGEIKKEMKSLVNKYKSTEGEEKESIKNELKKLTKIKKELEALI